MAPQISIIGAGIAGLVLGQVLRKRQITAIIWEKSKQIPALQNFGITLQPDVYQSLLQHLELDENAFYNDNAIYSRDSHSAGSAVRVNRSAILRTLAKDLDIRWDHKLSSLSRGTDARHKLVFDTQNDQQQTHECDVVLVADGVHSATRISLQLDKNAFKLEVLPFVVYNGKRRFSADQLPDGLTGCLSPDGLSHAVGNVFLQINAGYNDTKKNEIGINYTLSRPAEKSDDELLARGNSDAESLARRFLDEASKLKDLNEPFKSVFNPDTMKDDRLLHWLMRSALIDPAVASDLVKQGIVLLGDAASPQPILGGYGANAATLDALSIAGSISAAGEVDTLAYDNLQKQWRTWKDDAEANLSKMHQTAARASI